MTTEDRAVAAGDSVVPTRWQAVFEALTGRIAGRFARVESRFRTRQLVLTHAEPGNLFFDWSRSTENPNQFVPLEAFVDGDAGAAHAQSEHFRAGLETMAEAIAETPEIINVEIPGPRAGARWRNWCRRTRRKNRREQPGAGNGAYSSRNMMPIARVSPSTA